MSKICDISGKKVLFGNNVSHAKNKTRRKFYPNLQTKKIFLPEKNKWIKLKLSMHILRTINKNGINNVLRQAKKQGTLAKKFWHVIT